MSPEDPRPAEESHPEPVIEELKAKWREEQLILRGLRVEDDELSFAIPDKRDGDWTGLKYVAGVDVSFVEGSSKAVGAICILEFPSLKSIFGRCIEVSITLPYIAGFLAFREVVVYEALLKAVREEQPDIFPQVCFVDGNGTLHPLRFGSACHLGVACNIPTLGIAKNFLNIDSEGLEMESVKRESAIKLAHEKSYFSLVGTSGITFGCAVRSNKESKNPVFVSPGHKISLDTAVKLTMRCSIFRQPEPIRFADHLGREYIRKYCS